MGRILTAVGLGLSVAVLGGCYESKVPLGDSHESKIEPELLGDWSGQVVTKGGDVSVRSEPVRVVVRRLNEHEYFISFAFGGKPAALTRAYSVEIDGVRFMNFQNIDAVEEKERVFVFARYELTEDGEVVVRFVNKKPLLEGRRFESSDAFRKFVKEHLDDEELYTPSTRLKRVEGLEVKIEPTSGD